MFSDQRNFIEPLICLPWDPIFSGALKSRFGSRIIFDPHPVPCVHVLCASATIFVGRGSLTIFGRRGKLKKESYFRDRPIRFCVSPFELPCMSVIIALMCGSGQI